jgi:hypothetical protein
MIRVLSEEPKYLLIIQSLTQNLRFLYCFCTAGEDFSHGLAPFGGIRSKRDLHLVVTVYARHSESARKVK